MKQTKNTSALIIGILIFGLATIVSAQRDIINIDVKFKKMADSATYNNTIRGYGVIDHTFRAEKGQKTEINLNAKNNALYFNLLDTETMLPIETDPLPREVRSWDGILPKTGEFKIRVYLIRAEARRNRVAPFTLNLRITGGNTASREIWGNYVSDGYDKRGEGYDWVGVSVTKINDFRAKISVRSRADRKRPTCLFDTNATIDGENLLKVYGDNVVINFRFSGEKLFIEPGRPEDRDKLYFFCSGGASLAGEYVKTTGDLDRRQIDRTAYFKSVTFNNYRFNVEVIDNTLSIQPIGLEVDNRIFKHRIEGSVTDVEIGDLNSDSSPEIFIYISSKGNVPYGSVIGYSVNNGKSMSQIAIPEIADIAEAKEGYGGNDEFAIVETGFIRLFPVYRKTGDGMEPTGQIRQIQFKLAEGEASRRLVPVKILVFADRKR